MSTGSERMADLDGWLAAHRDELVAFRRHLHAHPELSGEEYETTAYVVERLTVAGLEPRVLPGGTGVLCDLAPDAPGPTVALRADLDALAMDDEKDVPYRSTRPGVTHACGHDVHTTAVLGAGLALHALAGNGLERNVRLVFQPAEERLPGGALEVIDAGGMEDVGLIYGLHCDPRVPVGRIGLRTGSITSATDKLQITLHGPGGHTARPERTADLVAIAASVVRDLEAEVEHQLSGRPISIVFGSLHAGEAANVIPARAELRGTARTPQLDVWEEVLPTVERALKVIVEPRGAGFEVDYTRGHPPVVNDPRAVDSVARAAQVGLGSDSIVEVPQSVGGDDFSWYLDRAPGCYIRLGVRAPDVDDAPDLHASHFDVDEGCIPVAVGLLVRLATQPA